MLFLYLFTSFFFVGLFGFGGDYGMLSLIQGEVVHHYHWLSTAEFTDMVALSQAAPGPVGLNAAAYCGFTAVQNGGYGYLASILGSFTATVAVCLPAVILMILISRLYLKYMGTTATRSFLGSLRPAIVGVLCAATLMLLLSTDNFGSPSVSPWRFWISCFLFVATLIGTGYMKINPIRMICYSAIAGLVLLY